MSYAKVPNCRICAHPDDTVISEMDADILGGVILPTVQVKYAHEFGDPAKPLSQVSLANHRFHLRASVKNALVGIPDLSSGQSGEIVSSKRSEGFDSYTGMLAKNRELLEIVVASAIDDLMDSDAMLKAATDSKGQAALLGARDGMRRSVVEVTKITKDLMDPAINVLDGASNVALIELLKIVRTAAIKAIVDEEIRNSYFNELTTKIKRSKELRWMLETANKTQVNQSSPSEESQNSPT